MIRSEEHCVPEAGMQWHILVYQLYPDYYNLSQ